MNNDEIHHITEIPYLDKINHIIDIIHMNEIHFLTLEIPHLRFRPLIKLMIFINEIFYTN